MNDLADKIFIVVTTISLIVALYCMALTEAAGAFLILSSAVVVAFVSNAQVTIGGFNWSLQDLTSVALITHLFLRPPRMSKLGQSKIIFFFLLILTVVIIASSIRGVSDGIPFKNVMNDLRGFLFPLLTIWYMACARPKPEVLRTVIHETVAAAIVLFFIAVYRYGLIASGHPPAAESAGEYVNYGGPTGAMVYRVLYSQDAIFMATSTIIVWYLSARQQAPRWMKVASFLLPPMIIYLQHRSVWIALGTMTLITAALGHTTNQVARRVIIVAVGALLIVLVAFPESKISTSLLASAENATGDKSTLTWREQSWQSMLTPSYMGDSVNYIFGREMGSGTRRVVEGRFVEVEAHNLFVTMFTKSGIVGLISFLALIFLMLIKLWKLDGFARILATCIIGLLVYWWAYSFDEPQAFLIGLSILVIREPTIVSGLVITAKASKRPRFLPRRPGELPAPAFANYAPAQE